MDSQITAQQARMEIDFLPPHLTKVDGGFAVIIHNLELAASAQEDF